MTALRARCSLRRSADDEGFTLIEVVVALFLLGMVATAVLMFYVRGVQATAHLQRSQSADSVAMEAMEAVQSIDPQALTPSGAKALVAGRTKSAVESAWSAAATTDTADSTPVWDASATSTSVPAVPITRAVVRDTTSYSVTTLIGTCFRVASLTGADQPCTLANPGGGIQVYRATVVVSWKPTSVDQCQGAATCTYRTSALIDGNEDASWNLTARPVAYDDEISLGASSSPSLVKYEIVKTNDIIGSVTANPVVVITPPAGTYSIITSGSEMGMLQYAPAAGYSGKTTMVYKLRDAAGRTSNEAKVVITVKPKAVADTVSVVKDTSTVINVLANDLGTFTGTSTVAVTSGPGVGSISVAGTVLTYTAPSTGTSTSFKYTVTDAGGQTSDEVTVSVTLLTPAPMASNLAISLNASASPTAKDLGILAATSNDATSKVVVVSGPTAVSSWGSVGTLTGSNSANVYYKPIASTVGVYTLAYYVQNSSGAKSATMAVTITVIPVANADSITVATSSTKSTALAANDVPTTGMTYALAGSLDCGWRNSDSSINLKGATVAITSAGSLTFKAPTAIPTSGSCSVPYSITRTVGSGASASTVTVSATATLKVS